MSIYLHLPGVTGNVSEKNHVGWVALEALSFTAERNVTNTTGYAPNRVKGHAVIGAASILKHHDNSSLMLWQNLLDAKVIPQVTIDVSHTHSSGLATQMRYTLNDVIVSHFEDGFESSAHSSDHEYLQLSFTKIEKRCTPYDSKGKAGAPMTAGYDVAEASVA